MHERILLFLDFDGVLHPQYEGQQQVPDEVAFCHLPRLEALLRAFPEVDVVISSTWRQKVALDELKNYFSEDIRARIVGATPVVNGCNLTLHRREVEILKWLSENGRADSRWCALDDAHWQFQDHKENLVRCKSYAGFDEGAEIRLRTALLKLRSGGRACAEHGQAEAHVDVGAG